MYVIVYLRIIVKTTGKTEMGFLSEGMTCWDQLTELSMKRCHALKLEDFCEFIPTLPSLQTLHLEQMFREPPKGCSR